MSRCTWTQLPDGMWEGTCDAKDTSHPGMYEICPGCGELIENPGPSLMPDFVDYIERDVVDVTLPDVPAAFSVTHTGGATVAYIGW